MVHEDGAAVLAEEHAREALRARSKGRFSKAEELHESAADMYELAACSLPASSSSAAARHSLLRLAAYQREQASWVRDVLNAAGPEPSADALLMQSVFGQPVFSEHGIASSPVRVFSRPLPSPSPSPFVLVGAGGGGERDVLLPSVDEGGRVAAALAAEVARLREELADSRHKCEAYEREVRRLRSLLMKQQQQQGQQAPNISPKKEKF
eukprot:m51a1_g3451 hypothetical protein (209) ;mRNA; f:680769-681395